MLLAGVAVLALLVATVLGTAAHQARRPRAGYPVREAATTPAPGARSTSRADTGRTSQPSVRPGHTEIIELPAGDAPNGERAVWIYRPGVPDSPRVPVLYFLHGLPGSDTDLAGTGIAADLDAAFESGRLPPFVVVAPDGNSTAATDTEWADSADGTVRLQTFLTTTLIAAVEGANRRDRNHRAIAGFSMGGYGAMNTALRRPDLYGQVVSIAGYFHTDDTSGIFDGDPTVEAANSPDQHVDAAADLRVMLVDGQDDLEPVVEGEVQRFTALLRSTGQQPTVLIHPGGHDWTFVGSVLPDVEAFLEAGWSRD